MALPDFTGPRSLPRIGRYQTTAQRISRLEMLADAERRRLQMQFQKEARNAYKDFGTLHGLQDRKLMPTGTPHGRIEDYRSSFLPSGVNLAVGGSDAFFDKARNTVRISPQILTGPGGQGTLAHEGAHATEPADLNRLQAAFDSLSESERQSFFRTSQGVLGQQGQGSIQNRYGVGGVKELYADIVAVQRLGGNVPQPLLQAIAPPDWRTQGNFLERATTGISRAVSAGSELLRTNPIIGGPFAETEGPGTSAAARFQTRFGDPAAAGLVQLYKHDPLERKLAETVGQEPRFDVKPLPPGGKFVNPVKAWWGNEIEQQRAQKVLAEADWLPAMIARAIADPTLLIPFVGVTKVDDFVNGARNISKLTGPARARALTAFKESETFQTVAKAVRSEVGGVATENIPRRAALLEQALLDAPPEEKIQTTVTRLHKGELQLFGDEARVQHADIQKAAQAARLPRIAQRNPASETFIDALETHSLDALPPEQQAVARQLRDVLDEETRLTLAADPDFKLHPDYTPHFFKKVGAKGRMVKQAPPSFVRKRRLEGSIMEVLDEHPGLDLRTWDPVDYVYLRVAEGIRYRALMRLQERLKMSGAMMLKENAPVDWVVPDAPMFRRRIPFPTKEGGAGIRAIDYAVPPEVASALNNHFGQSYFNVSPPLRAVRATVAALKLTKTAGGLFQHIDYTMRLLGGRGLGHFKPQAVPAAAKALVRGFVPKVHDDLLRWELKDPLSRSLLENGIQVDGGLDILERSTRDLLADEGFLFARKLGENRPTRIAKSILDYVTSGNYLRAHREYVMSAGRIKAQVYMDQGMSVGEAAAIAARETNEQFSSIPAWQSVVGNPGNRDLVRTLLFSGPEQEGWTKNFLRPIIGPRRMQGAKFYGGILFSTAIFANMVHFLTTGEPLPVDRYNPVDQKKNMLGLPVSYNVQFLRPTLPFTGTTGQELYLDILGQADTPIRWLLDPVFGTKSRLSQPAQLATQLSPLLQGEGATVRTFGGKPVKGTPRGIAEYGAEFAAPIPVTGFFDERSRIGEVGAGIQAGGINVSAEPLRELLARRFEQEFKRSFNPETDYGMAEQSDALRPILDEMRLRGLEFGSKGALRSQNLEAARSQLEEEKRLPDLARQFQEGNLSVAPELLKRWEDVSQEMGGAFVLAFLGDDARDPKTPEGEAVKAWRDVDSYDPKYADPLTGEVDWSQFYDDQEEAFNNIPKDIRKALEKHLTSQSPDLKEIEPQLREIKRMKRAYYDLPKYRGLTKTEGIELDALKRNVDRERRQVAAQTGEADVPDDSFWLDRLSSMPPKLREFVQKYYISGGTRRKRGYGFAASGQKGIISGRRKRDGAEKESPLNPERPLFLMENPSLYLFVFQPTFEAAAAGAIPEEILAAR